MKIFISWSTEHSREIAEALGDWLGRLIQVLDPYVSSGIPKGAKWANEIDGALEGSNMGIVCLTPDNLSSTWIHYEAGAISKVQTVSRVCTFLVGMTPTQVVQPLSKFQATVAEKADLLKLVLDINKTLTTCGQEPRKESDLKEDFEDRWPKFEAKLKDIETKILVTKSESNDTPETPKRSTDDMVAEILEIVRGQERLRDRDRQRYLVRTAEPNGEIDVLSMHGHLRLENEGHIPEDKMAYGVSVYFGSNATKDDIDEVSGFIYQVLGKNFKNMADLHLPDGRMLNFEFVQPLSKRFISVNFAALTKFKSIRMWEYTGP